MQKTIIEQITAEAWRLYPGTTKKDAMARLRYACAKAKESEEVER